MSAEHLGALLRYHRERAGLSRRALSELCGASETAIYDAEGGKVTARLSTLLTIAGALSVTLSARGPLSADFLEQLRPDERLGTDADQ
mgnify:CR=1 FL=1